MGYKSMIGAEGNTYRKVGTKQQSIMGLQNDILKQICRNNNKSGSQGIITLDLVEKGAKICWESVKCIKI